MRVRAGTAPRLRFCACAAWPVVMLRTTSGRMSAHICNALIEPHSMILLLSQWRETGLVRKSLQPAASAATRSLWREDAVRATMMTDERYEGVVAERAVSEVEVDADASDGVCWPSDCGVDGKPPTPLVFSSFRISFVAWIPSMTGIWMSICSHKR